MNEIMQFLDVTFGALVLIFTVINLAACWHVRIVPIN